MGMTATTVHWMMMTTLIVMMKDLKLIILKRYFRMIIA